MKPLNDLLQNWLKPVLLCLMLSYQTLAFALDMDRNYLTQSESKVSDFNLTTGDMIPSVGLFDSKGEKHNLRLLSKQQNILLVIYRGEWCPFCIAQLNSFEAVLPELKNFNTRLVAVSPDDQNTTKNTQHQFGTDYLFLTDSEFKLIDALGLKNDEELPHPATILIAQGGKVLWFYADSNYKVRPSGKQTYQILSRFLTKKP